MNAIGVSNRCQLAPAGRIPIVETEGGTSGREEESPLRSANGSTRSFVAGAVRHLGSFWNAERSGRKRKTQTRNGADRVDRREDRTGRRTSLPQGLRTGSLVAARNGPAPIAGFAGPRVEQRSVETGPEHLVCVFHCQRASAAVPLAGRPRAAGAPAARGSRSAWPPRRIRDGTHRSNPRAKPGQSAGGRSGVATVRAPRTRRRKAKINYGGIEV